MNKFLPVLFALLPVAVSGQQDPSKIRARPLGPDGKPIAVETVKSSAEKEDLLAYADLLFGQKQYALAARQYQIFLKDHPKSPNIQAGWFRLGECYLQVGQTSDAETTFGYVIQAFKTGPFVGSAAYRIAVIRYNAKDFVNAQKRFETARDNLSSPEAKLQASFYLARCLQFAEKSKEAIATYELVLAAKAPDPEKAADWKNPFRERCLLETARLFYDLGDAKAAFERFEVLSGSAENADYREEALARAGLLAAEIGETEKSVKYLDQALKIEGESPWKSLAKVGLIFNHFAREEYDELLTVYNRGIDKAPADTRPKLLLIVGHSYRLTDDLPSAIETYEMVEENFRDQPEGAEAGYRKLQCLHQKKDGGLTVYIDQYVSQQRELDPGNKFIDLALLMKAESHFADAQTAVRRDESAMARDRYTDAAGAYGRVREEKIPEKFHEARLYKLGWSQIESEDIPKGALTLGTFIRRFPDSALVTSALAKRATAMQAKGDFEGALSDYREIVNQHPEADDVEFALQQIALIHGNQRKIPEMVAAYEALLAKFPETPGAAEAHYWIGFGKFDQEDYAGSIEPLDRARKRDPKTYGAKGSWRIILAHYQLEDLEALATEAEAYLDADAASPEPDEEPEKSNDPKTGGDKPAVARPLPADRPPIPAGVLSYLGQRLFDKQDYKRAERFLTAASTPARPTETSVTIWELLGQSRMELKLFSKAIEPWDHYLSMTQRPSDRGKAFLAKGQAFHELNQPEKARESARECLKSVKQGRINARARILLGDISASEGDMAGAAREYLVVSQIFIDDEITPVALQKAAAAYRQAGEIEKAADLEEQLKTKFPDFNGTASIGNAGE